MLSIPVLLFVVVVELLIVLFIHAYVQDYEKESRVPVFLFLVSALSTLFYLFLVGTGWFIYAY